MLRGPDIAETSMIRCIDQRQDNTDDNNNNRTIQGDERSKDHGKEERTRGEVVAAEVEVVAHDQQLPGTENDVGMFWNAEI